MAERFSVPGSVDLGSDDDWSPEEREAWAAALERHIAPYAARVRPELFAERGDPHEARREDERLMAAFAPLRRQAEDR